MNIAGLIAALFLPAFLGIAWLHLLWGNSHWAARVGYGYLLGIFIITLALRAWGGVGLGLNFPFISALIFVLGAIPLFLLSVRKNHQDRVVYIPTVTSWKRIVFVVLIAILAVRYGGAFLEIIWRPLYPWDAWMNWVPKAKIWFELKELVPIVTMSEWGQESVHNGAYTLGSPPASTYPTIIPLIQAWTALGIGAWIDNLLNLPWLLCAVALGFAFYGQGRMLGAKPLNILLMLFLVLSMPYTNVHTALAGYAELWLATFYALAGMAFINWSQTRDVKQAALCIIFAIACTQTKNPGLVWAATFIPASIFVFLPRRWGHIAIGLVISALAVLVYFGGFSVDIGGAKIALQPDMIRIPGLGSFRINYHPVGEKFIDNFLVWGSWHLLGWAFLIIAIPMFVIAIQSYKLYPATALVLQGILFLYFVFFFTSHYKAALDNTTINRAVFHMMPLTCFYLLFMMNFISRKNGVARKTEVTTPNPG